MRTLSCLACKVYALQAVSYLASAQRITSTFHYHCDSPTQDENGPLSTLLDPPVALRRFTLRCWTCPLWRIGQGSALLNRRLSLSVTYIWYLKANSCYGILQLSGYAKAGTRSQPRGLVEAANENDLQWSLRISDIYGKECFVYKCTIDELTTATTTMIDEIFRKVPNTQLACLSTRS